MYFSQLSQHHAFAWTIITIKLFSLAHVVGLRYHKQLEDGLFQRNMLQIKMKIKFLICSCYVESCIAHFTSAPYKQSFRERTTIHTLSSTWSHELPPKISVILWDNSTSPTQYYVRWGELSCLSHIWNLESTIFPNMRINVTTLISTHVQFLAKI